MSQSDITTATTTATPTPPPPERMTDRFLDGKTVLLTGATGYIARELAPHLAAWGARVIGTARRASPSGDGVAEWRRMELTDSTESMRAACHGVDIVLHAAALRGERGLPASAVHAANVEGTQRLYAAAAAEGVHTFAFFSTVGVFGFAENVDETTPFAWDDSDYHRSKAEAEVWLRDQDAVERLLILRPCVVYGEGRDDGFVYNLAKLVRKRAFLPIGWGKRTHLEMIHIDNLIEAIRVVLEKGKDGDAFIMTDGVALTVDEIAKAVARAYGTTIPRVRLPELPVRLASHVIDRGLRAVGKAPPITPHKLDLFTRPQTYRIDRVRALGYTPTRHPAEAIEAVVRAWARGK